MTNGFADVLRVVYYLSSRNVSRAGSDIQKTETALTTESNQITRRIREVHSRIRQRFTLSPKETDRQ